VRGEIPGHHVGDCGAVLGAVNASVLRTDRDNNRTRRWALTAPPRSAETRHLRDGRRGLPATPYVGTVNVSSADVLVHSRERAVVLHLTSGDPRVLELADGARLSAPFFIVTRRYAHSGEIHTVLTLLATDVVSADILENSVRVEVVLGLGGASNTDRKA
jgi:hypothetical protein